VRRAGSNPAEGTMAVDKRKVATDALETLGTLIDDSGKRDAIHLAVEAIYAGETLYPGQQIGITKGLAYASASKKLGIVDPFLTAPVFAGSRFWLIVFPRQITSLRHVWEHPDFEQIDSIPKVEIKEIIKEVEVVKEVIVYKDAPLIRTAEVEQSENWIHSYASDLGVEYDDLMESASNYQSYGDYMVRGGTLEGEHTSEEFWKHYQIVTGKYAKNKDNFFSCSC
jgi:hypothetical protein